MIGNKINITPHLKKYKNLFLGGNFIFNKYPMQMKNKMFIA